MIFQTNKDGSLPPHVMYKIRQNSSFTEKTNEIRRAYWRPGPNTGGRFYFLYGFVWIQGEHAWLFPCLSERLAKHMLRFTALMSVKWCPLTLG